MGLALAIDPVDPTPIYAQLERSLRAAIASGRLRPGDQLPTVRELAVELAVNANTVARVYASLERDGALETRRGVGTFVSTTPPKPIPQRERERLLRAFATRVLADAETQGFSLADVLGALGARRTGGSK
jgi:GntR family transcriptional regulator